MGRGCNRMGGVSKRKSNRRGTTHRGCVVAKSKPTVDPIVEPTATVTATATIEPTTDVTLSVEPVEPTTDVTEPPVVPSVTVDPKSPWADERVTPNNRHTGRYTGMGIEQFQNRVYVMNACGMFGRHDDGSPRGLSDYQIAILWAVEFPHAKCDYMAHVDYVASTRTAYVNGRHANPRPVPGCGLTFTHDGTIGTKPYRGPSR